MAVLAMACGGATKFPDEEVVGERPAPAVGSATSLPPASAPTTLPAAATTTRPAPPPPPSRAAPSSPPRATATRAPAPAVDTGDLAIRRAALGPPGGAAGIILQAAPARSLVLEILEEPGAAANRAALDRVLADLRRYSGKPVVEVHTALPPGSPSRRWSEAELAALADRSSTVPQGGARFVLRLVSVRGQNARSGDILAVSFRGDTMASFPDRYASSSQQVITAITVHEVGHLLGLVDLYLNRRRADTQSDPAREGHSTNPASVMYFAVDPSFLGSVLGSASERFDLQDERDLAAIRAGAPPGSNP